MERVIQLNQLLIQVQQLRESLQRILGLREPEARRIGVQGLLSDYQTWHAACTALLPSDLGEQFAQVSTLKPDGIRSLGAVLDDLATAADQPTVPVSMSTTYRLRNLLERQVDIVAVARQRAFTNPSQLPRAVRRTIEQLSRKSQLATIDLLFRRSGCEPNWWMPPIKPDESERVSRTRGWFDGILVHAPDREIALTRDIIEEMLEDQKWSQEKRTQLRELLASLNEESTSPAEPMPLTLLASMHHRVREVTETLLAGGHYDEALLAACVALVNAVKDQAARPDLDGTGLMNTIFSPNRPILHVPDRRYEQQGVMALMSGAVQALRNPRAHNTLAADERMDADEIMEWLGFVSALFRILDQSHV